MATTVATLEAVLKLRDELGPSLSKSVEGVVKNVAGMLSFGAAVKVATDALKAQGEQEAAINKLNLALANQGKFSDATSQSLIDYSAALQNVSTYADENILAGEALLVSFGLTEAQVKSATKAALDYAAATGTDLETAFQMLGKASAGSVTALQKQGFVFEEGMTKAQKFDSAIAQIEGRFGGSALAATETFGGQMEVLKNQIGEVEEGLGKFLGSLLDLGGGTQNIKAGLQFVADFFGAVLPIGLGYARKALLDFYGTMLDGFAKIAGVLSNPVLARVLTGGLWGGISAEAVQGIKDMAGAFHFQADEALKAGIAVADSAGHIQKYTNVVKPAAEATHGFAKSSADLGGIMMRMGEAFAQADGSSVGYVTSLKELTQEQPILTQGTHDLVATIRQKVYDTLLDQKAQEGLSRVTKRVVADMVAAKQITQEQANAFLNAGNAAETFGSTMSKALSGLGTVILQAIQGGGDVAKAAGAHLGGSLGKYASEHFGKSLQSLLGNTLGSALSSVLPGLGSILGAGIGALVGKIGGAIGGLFRNEVIEKVNDMRDAFFEAHGGFSAFSREMAAVSKEDWAKKIFNAKTVEDFNRLVGEAEGLLGSQKQAQEDLQKAVEKYGFTVDELGPKWQAQELDKKAGELLKDYSLLVASGIDVNTVIEKMGPNLNEYVNTARAAGQAIPENMRPIIEKMIEQGQLLDENGNAFTSVEDAGISFTKSLSEGLQDVVDSIKALVSALTGIPPVHIPVTYDDPGRPIAYHDPEDVPHYARGTTFVPRDGLAYLHRGEAVTTAADNRSGQATMASEIAALRSQLTQLLHPNELARAFRAAGQLA